MSAQENLLKEVRESIEKALPAIQVDVFRKYVDEAEKAKKDLDSAVKTVDSLNKELKDAKERLTKLEYLNHNAEELKKGLEELRLAKLTFDIEKQLKEASVKFSEEKVTLVKGLFNDVFRNIEVRQFLTGSVPVIHRDANGNQWSGKEQVDNLEKTVVKQ